MARKEFIEAAYIISKEFYENKLTIHDAIHKLSGLGMNPGSARININVFKYLMNGDKFTRTLTAHTFDFFLQNILNDFGAERLSKCLDALSKHIKYIENKRNYKMKLVQDVYKKYVSLFNDIVDKESDEDEITFPEGREKYQLHKSKERNRKLISLAKSKYKSSDPKMRCQVCQFSFIDNYGEFGADFIEAHHILPISALSKETPIRIEDLAMVCSNCHRMLHRKRPWLGIGDLKKLLSNNAIR